MANRDLTTDRHDRLNSIASGAKSVLGDLDTFLEKNRAGPEKGRKILKRV